MWISKRTDYATRALLTLSLNEAEEPLKTQAIAERTAVPPTTLEQVMLALRAAGMVRSERGPAGGYRLNREPADITLEEVVRVFQGPLAPIACATRKHPEPCPMQEGCSMLDVWQEVRDATIGILQRTTFADLARRAGGRWLATSSPPVP